jgi:hypothetical protein
MARRRAGGRARDRKGRKSGDRPMMEPILAALAEVEERRKPWSVVSLRVFQDGAGMIECEEPTGAIECFFIWYSLAELIEWLAASPPERIAIELNERAAREERETRDFKTLDLFFADSGGVN